MNRTILIQLISAVVVLFLLLLAANPFQLWMPGPVVMLVVCALTVAFFSFSVFIFREKYQDERDQLHSMMAGRLSFFVGSTILLIAIVIKELQGSPDPWIIAALGAMVFTKLIVRIVAEIQA